MNVTFTWIKCRFKGLSRSSKHHQSKLTRMYLAAGLGNGKHELTAPHQKPLLSPIHNIHEHGDKLFLACLHEEFSSKNSRDKLQWPVCFRAAAAVFVASIRRHTLKAKGKANWLGWLQWTFPVAICTCTTHMQPTQPVLPSPRAAGSRWQPCVVVSHKNHRMKDSTWALDSFEKSCSPCGRGDGLCHKAGSIMIECHENWHSTSHLVRPFLCRYMWYDFNYKNMWMCALVLVSHSCHFCGVRLHDEMWRQLCNLEMANFVWSLPWIEHDTRRSLAAALSFLFSDKLFCVHAIWNGTATNQR